MTNTNEETTDEIDIEEEKEWLNWAYLATHPVKFSLVNKLARLPEIQKEGNACFDLFSAESWVIDSGKWVAIDTGLQMEMPVYLEARIRPRSGLAMKKGLTVLNAPGTIDSGYRGNVKVILINHSDIEQGIAAGDRIAQMSFHGRCHVDFEVVEKLDESERGTGGFGSTGE